MAYQSVIDMSIPSRAVVGKTYRTPCFRTSNFGAILLGTGIQVFNSRERVRDGWMLSRIFWDRTRGTTRRPRISM